MLFWTKRHASEADLNALVDGALREGSRARLSVEGHVAGCEACRATLDELQALKASLAALPQAAAPRSFAVRRSDVEPAPVVRAPAGGTPALLGGLAMVALVTFVTLVAVDVSDPSSGGSGADGTLSMSSDDRQAESAPQPNEPTTAGAASDAAAEDGEIPTAPPAEVKALDEAMEDDEGSDIPLRAAEAATAGLALVAGGALFYGWRRRTGSPG